MLNSENTNGDVPTREYRAYDGNSALRLYLNEIGQVRLITPAEEITLAKRIKKGDMSARTQMIEANLRLVVKIARDYDRGGIPLLDLINEGNLGLMKAVERFDPAKGAKLSTYASWWIKQSILRALQTQSKDVRIPVHMLEKISKMRQVVINLSDELKREPTDEEIASELGKPLEYVSKLRKYALQPVSLDDQLGFESDSGTLSDVIPDERAELASDVAWKNSMKEIIWEMLEKLETREVLILMKRFGFDGGKKRTLDDIALMLGVTRERARQLETLALLKLKNMLESFDETGKLAKVSTNGENSHLKKAKVSLLAAGDVSHFRASPAFIHWKPNAKQRKNAAQALLAFVGFAYEIEVTKITNPDSSEEKWASRVFHYMASKSLLNLSLNGTGIESVQEETAGVELSAEKNLLVAKDMEKMKLHFKAVMGL